MNLDVERVRACDRGHDRFMQLDHEHPCLICGAGWDHVAEECSAHCFERGPGEAVAYQVGVRKRTERGWDLPVATPAA